MISQNTKNFKHIPFINIRLLYKLSLCKGYARAQQNQEGEKGSMKDRATWGEICGFFALINECIPKTLKLKKQKAEALWF